MGLLDAFDDDFNEAEEIDFSPIIDGKYLAKINKVEIKTSKINDRPYLNWNFIICSDGDFFGRHVFKVSMLTNEGRNLSFIKTDLSNLEIELKRFSDLEKDEVLEKFLDIFCKITLSTKKNKEGEKNQYTYINKKVDLDPESIEEIENALLEKKESAGKELNNEDIPF